MNGNHVASITYRKLFSVLRSLGFQERRTDSDSRKQHVFVHDETDTWLAFGRQPDDAVTPADMLSTEVHLHARGIIDQPFESLTGRTAAKRR